jgi:hypothetical protein
MAEIGASNHEQSIQMTTSLIAWSCCISLGIASRVFSSTVKPCGAAGDLRLRQIQNDQE